MARPLPPLALAYHGVADVPIRRDPHGLFVRPADLRRHIARLRSWGYELVPFGELAARVRDGGAAGLAALTFDDGLVDNLEVLLPLLRADEASATVFVVAGWLGRPYPYAPSTRLMDAAEVAELAAGGVEIGGHTMTHPDLSALPFDRARDELRECRLALAELTGREVTVAAYPFGRAGPDTPRACAAAGFAAACRTSGRGSWSDPHDLPRQDMDNAATMLGLRLKRSARFEPLMRHRSARALRRLVRIAKGLRR